MRGIIFVLSIALAFAITGAGMATANPLADAAKRFAADDFGETAAAVVIVSESVEPHASALLDALLNRRLFVADDKSVFYRDGQDNAFDAVTGRALQDAPKSAATVRVNNRLRGAIEASIGSMTLGSADPVKRRAAADAIFKSRDEKALPALAAALEREQDPGVRLRFEVARAAVIATQSSASTSSRLDAIAVLQTRGDRDALSLLKSIAADARQPDVQQSARIAAQAIEQRLSRLSVVQDLYYGLSLGSVLLLAAIGLAITFGVMGVINMAHGEMVMLGAYTTFVVQEVFRSFAPTALGWSLALALPLAFVVTALIGALIERGIIRFLYGRPLETLLATWGVSLVLQQSVRTLFGPTNREVSAPGFMSGSFDIGGIAITYGRMWIILFTLLLFAALLALLKLSPLGLQMRAVTQNRRMAGSMGINTARIDTVTFALGSGIAGLAGVALSQIDNVSPNLGQSYIIDSFMVVVFGGVGNLWGTLVSAFALGIANKFLEPFAGAVLAKILILVLLILFIQKRPRGLFALKGRAVET